MVIYSFCETSGKNRALQPVKNGLNNIIRYEHKIREEKTGGKKKVSESDVNFYEIQNVSMSAAHNSYQSNWKFNLQIFALVICFVRQRSLSISNKEIKK